MAQYFVNLFARTESSSISQGTCWVWSPSTWCCLKVNQSQLRDDTCSYTANQSTSITVSQCNGCHCTKLSTHSEKVSVIIYKGVSYVSYFKSKCYLGGIATTKNYFGFFRLHTLHLSQTVVLPFHQIYKDNFWRLSVFYLQASPNIEIIKITLK